MNSFICSLLEKAKQFCIKNLEFSSISTHILTTSVIISLSAVIGTKNNITSIKLWLIINSLFFMMLEIVIIYLVKK